MNHNPHMNSSGLPDPTAYAACKPLTDEEKKVTEIVHAFRDLSRLAGFEITNRIEFRSRDTGRTYR